MLRTDGQRVYTRAREMMIRYKCLTMKDLGKSEIRGPHVYNRSTAGT